MHTLPAFRQKQLSLVSFLAALVGYIFFRIAILVTVESSNMVIGLSQKAYEADAEGKGKARER